MSARADIAAAANTVEGVLVTEYYQQTTTTGAGMVRLAGTDYPDKFGGIDTWQVIVFLPQDLTQAEKWAETNQKLLVAALADEMTVRRAQPQQLALDGAGLLPVLVIEGTRESE